MLLAIDLGNRHVGFGVFDGTEPVRYGHVPADALHELTNRVGDERFSRIVLASVAPSRTEQVISLLASRYGMPVMVAGRDLSYGIDIQCDEPDKVGPDRLLNAVAAHARTGTATIVVDVGTATTVDLVSERGSFCGGAIAPGPDLMLQALHEHAELLPRTTLEKPASPFGHNTADAMRAGAYWGTVGLVERLVAEICAHQGSDLPILVTGGAGEPVAAELRRSAEFVPHLTLEGLARLARGG